MLKLNKLPIEKAQFLEGDVFQVLRKFRDEGRTFDMIILDPPKFAPTAAQADKAARGYKDINLLAFKLVRSNGILVNVLLLRRRGRGALSKDHCLAPRSDAER